MSNYETPKQAGYRYIYSDKDTGLHMFYNVTTHVMECFAKSKNHAGWALNWRNTQLEFCSSWDDAHLLQFKRGIKAIHNYGEQHPSFKYAWRIMKKLNMIYDNQNN